MSELKPCPFCGGEAKVFHYSSAILDEVWRVVCDSPFCAQGPDGYTEAEAVDAWNTRAVDTCRDSSNTELLFECSECGSVLGTMAYPFPNYCPNCGRKVER